MNQTLLETFGDSNQRIEKALASLRNGQGILVTDNEDRENEGDLIYPAETITAKQVALQIRECSGIICLCMTNEKADSLKLPLMVPSNTSHYKTNFTISIEAATGVTTGVSARDRAVTIRTAAKPDAGPKDLNHPGHVFPLRARPGGVLERPGHTEATVDLMRLAGLQPCGVLCELTNPDGTMARLPEIITFASRHQYPVVTVEDIIEYRMSIGQ